MSGCGSSTARPDSESLTEIKPVIDESETAADPVIDPAGDRVFSSEFIQNPSNQEILAETVAAGGKLSEEIPVWQNMTAERSMDLIYASQFTVDFLPGGYKYFTIAPDQKLLLIPENVPAPEGLDTDIVILQAPLDQIYLVATAAMDYFRQLDCMERITLSSQKQSGWYIDEAREAMESGSMVYAGKYSAPDYEVILQNGCDLAIENTMIYHTPEVLEQLRELGVPYLVEKSSYESEPLGRMEWLKFYAALVDQEEEAEAYYRELLEQVEPVLGQEPTGKTVAFFYINSNGAVNVRKSADYVAKAIEMAGGTYVSFDESEEENALSTMTIQMETFYANARNADVLIYNSTIDGELQTIDQLLMKSSLLEDFKAVQEGNVWCIEKNFYQESLELGNMILDVHAILTEDKPNDGELHFLHHLP